MNIKLYIKLKLLKLTYKIEYFFIDISGFFDMIGRKIKNIRWKYIEPL